MHRIAQGDLYVNRSPVQLHHAASTAGVSAEILAANQRLLAQRANKQRVGNDWLHALRRGLAQPQTPPPPSAVETATPLPETVKINPSLALAILQTQQATAGRIWLLCRVIDIEGRGWLSVAQLRERLTAKGSDLRVCGWRRLRQILQAGDGVFWRRDSAEKLWLKSVKRVALALKVPSLQGAAIALPRHILTKNIRVVKAHLYATFHSKRAATPISRQTLATITGVPERTQRDYDRIANTTVKRNIALSERYSAEKQQAVSFSRPGVFTFTDKLGKQGAINQRYIAWRLPNSYQAAHDRTIHGQQRKINRWLNSHTDLVKNRAQGNGGHTDYRQLFFDPAEKPVKKARFDGEYFWRDPLTTLWHHQENPMIKSNA